MTLRIYKVDPTRDRAVEQELLRDGHQVAVVAASLAPKDSGAGARSIRAELFPGQEVRVCWDVEHFYMEFAEIGTEKERPRPFLRPAANQFR